MRPIMAGLRRAGARGKSRTRPGPQQASPVLPARRRVDAPIPYNARAFG